MNTPEAQELKLYEVTHRATGERHYAVSHTAQDACSQAGWLIGDCYIVKQRPLAKYDKHERAILLVKIPCRVCPYQRTECVKPDDAECPTRPETPDLNQWLKETSKAHLCPYTGQDLGKKDYEKRLKGVSLEEATNELTPQPLATPPNSSIPTCPTPLTML